MFVVVVGLMRLWRAEGWERRKEGEGESGRGQRRGLGTLGDWRSPVAQREAQHQQSATTGCIL